jgi:hypothetical protein
VNPNPHVRDDDVSGRTVPVEGPTSSRHTKTFAMIAIAIALLCAAPALAQSCTRQGNDVTCDVGKRGISIGDAIIWADGTRANLASQHPSVVIGNKSSVIVGQGVMVGSRGGKGVVPDGEPRADEMSRAGWGGVLLLRTRRHFSSRHSGAPRKRRARNPYRVISQMCRMVAATVFAKQMAAVMDSGLAPSGAPRNDELRDISDTVRRNSPYAAATARVGSRAEAAPPRA